MSVRPTPVPLEHDTLHRLLEVSRLLSVTPDLRDILSLIIDAMRDLLDAERATVFEFDEDANELVTTVAHGLTHEAEETTDERAVVRVGIDHGIVGAAATSRRIINVPDAYADERFNKETDVRTGFRTRSILSIPLLDVEEQLVGVAQVLNKRSRPFNQEDEALATALAAQAAVAIKRAHLVQHQIFRQKMERELELARKIQQATFPDHVPAIPGYDLAAWSEPADSTGGDTYDIVPIREQVTEASDCDCSRVLLLMADAAGHGIGPALHATEIRAMLRMAVRLGAELTAIATHLNGQLCQDMPAGHFITAWLGLLDATTNSLLSFSAGQAPLFRYDARTKKVHELGADTPPYGIADDIDPTCARVINMQPGDLFVVMSDGICESTDEHEEQFGSERVEALLRKAADQPASRIITNILDHLAKFTKGRAAIDDRTILITKRTT